MLLISATPPSAPVVRLRSLPTGGMFTVAEVIREISDTFAVEEIKIDEKYVPLRIDAARLAAEYAAPATPHVYTLRELKDDFKTYQTLTPAEREKFSRDRIRQQNAQDDQILHLSARYAAWVAHFNNNFSGDAFSQIFTQLATERRLDFLQCIIFGEKLRESHREYKSLRTAFVTHPIAVENLLSQIVSTITPDEKLALAKLLVRYNGWSYPVSRDLKLTPAENSRIDPELDRFEKEYAGDFLPVITDAMIDTCVINNDREGLQYLIYQRFSGIYHLYHWDFGYEETRRLRDLVRSRAIDLQELAREFKTAMRIQPQIFQHKAVELAIPMLSPPRPRYWSEGWGDTQRARNTIVDFSHGGGGFHILSFLTGRTPGYRLERNGQGIQVSPDQNVARLGTDTFLNGRLLGYAWGQPVWRQYDLPATFFARVEAQYLDSAPNGYEAGLRPEFASFLQGVQVEYCIDLQSRVVVQEEKHHVSPPSSAAAAAIVAAPATVVRAETVSTTTAHDCGSAAATPLLAGADTQSEENHVPSSAAAAAIAAAAAPATVVHTETVFTTAHDRASAAAMIAAGTGVYGGAGSTAPARDIVANQVATSSVTPATPLLPRDDNNQTSCWPRCALL